MECLFGLTLESYFHNLYTLCPLFIDSYGTAYHTWKIKRRQRRAIVMPLAETEELI